jgi:ribosomal protein S4
MVLAKSSSEEQEILFSKLRALGLKTNTTADVLALKIEDLLERRLPTAVFKKHLAKTTQEARQMVTHKRILIDNRVVDSPSFLVSVEEEGKITLKKKAKPKQSKGKVTSQDIKDSQSLTAPKNQKVLGEPIGVIDKVEPKKVEVVEVKS